MYYVYVYLDPRKPGKFVYKNKVFDFEPFYIGYGYGERIDSHLKFVKRAIFNNKKLFLQRYRKISKIISEDKEPIRIKLYENLSVFRAKRIEICLIKLLGRKDLGLGPLVNLTDGGDGIVNHICSDEYRRLQSFLTKEKWKNGVFKNRDIKGKKNGFFGKKHTEKTKEKIRLTIGDSRKGVQNSNFGKKWTKIQRSIARKKQKENHKHLIGEKNPSKRLEVREKISKTKIGEKNPNSKNWLLISPEGIEERFKGGLKQRLVEKKLVRYRFKGKGKLKVTEDGWKLYEL